MRKISVFKIVKMVLDHNGCGGTKIEVPPSPLVALLSILFFKLLDSRDSQISHVPNNPERAFRYPLCLSGV